MSKSWLLVLLAFLLCPQAAHAQPLFRIDQSWTVSIGDNQFGLREVIMTPGELRWTQVWLGCCSFDIHCRAAEFIPLVLCAPTDRALRFWCMIDWRSFQRRP